MCVCVCVLCIYVFVYFKHVSLCTLEEWEHCRETGEGRIGATSSNCKPDIDSSLMQGLEFSYKFDQD